jgi:histidinol-phosphate/aromatic aminotransferase/cobyric acid decarboxylase-like protein
MADEREATPHARVHGGLDARLLRARGIEPGSVVDFSVNINPYGPCTPVLEAARAAALDVYPDASAHVARSAWAEALGCTREHIAVGHGAADLFWAIARAVLPGRERVVIAEPTFSEFRIAAEAAGAAVERVFAAPAHDYRLDLPALARAGRGAAALYLCSPNNPTGEHVSLSRVRELAALLPQTLLVLDQSFLALSDHARELGDVLGAHALPDNVLRVRSLTKEFACPGLRIGLCVGSPSLIRRVEAMRPTWATSSPALAALTAAAREHTFVQASWQQMRADREAVAELLRARGFVARDSDTSYQLLALRSEARVFCERMQRAGVQLRDCASFGLARQVRIAALPAAARARLGQALDAVGSA